MSTSNRSSLIKINFWVILFLVNLLGATVALAQGTPPLVYGAENTGAQFPKPGLPSVGDLPIVRPLPDPFVFFDGSPRNTSFATWEKRRNEIKAAIEKYEIGPKPDNSDLTITAAYTPGSPGTLTVDVLRLSNGRTLRLTSTINLPSGTAPAAGWPAIIRMALAPGTGANSLGIATIDYVHDDVTQYAAGQQISHAGDPYFLMYPEYNAGPCPPAPAPCGIQVGQYSAWAWGVSRLIDGMEIARTQIVNPLPVDLRHLGVNGCSYAGKMALFAGAFDERIAATFAQESGGGGAPAWRVSHGIEPDGTVEKTNNTDGSWFINGMKTDFGGDSVYKLPEDHHLLMAMVAPRALLVSGNTDFTWLSNRSNYVTSKAAQRIYETFGIGDRFGFWIDGNHGHCALGANEQPMIDGFYQKFLLGQNINWDVHVYPATPAFTDLDYQRWTAWWGTGDPRFPDDPDTTPPSINLEAPSDGSVYLLHASVPANYSCSDTGSGLASCTGPVPSGNNIDTSTAGFHLFTINASDLAGNTSTRTVTYSVQYTFNFVNLLSMPAQNTANAGSTVVVRYQLKDSNGASISDFGSFTELNSFPASCLSLVPTGEAEQVNSTGSGLRYDSATGQFSYNWKTAKSWSNSCRVLELTLKDGTKHDAMMQFR